MPLFAIAGGLIGGVFATSVGATFLTGWAIGSLIGGLFAPGTQQTVSGPRLENTGPSASNIIGNPIQIPYGTVRMPASIIWSNSITEVTNVDKQSSGGSIGGGSSVKTITYTYFLDFAVAMAEGPIIGIKKIWVNNKIIYDQDATVQAEPWLNFDVYTGTETQLPDATMESKLGAGKVPAYRGLAYIVFKQFDLREYGNRVPQQIEVEVVASGSSAAVNTDIEEASEYLWSSGASYTTSVKAIPIKNGEQVIFGWPGSTQGWGAVVTLASVSSGVQYYTAGTEVTGLGYLALGFPTHRVASQNLIGINQEGDLVTKYTVNQKSGGDYWHDDYIAIYDTDGQLVTYRYLGIHNNSGATFYNYIGYVLNNYFIQLNTDAAYDKWRFSDCSSTGLNTVFSVENTLGVFVGFVGQISGYTMHNNKGTSVPGEYQIGPPLVDEDNEQVLATWVCTSDTAGLINKDWLIYSWEGSDLFSGVTNDSLQVHEYVYLDITDISVSGACAQNLSTVSEWVSVFAMLEVSGGVWLLVQYKDTDTKHYIMAAFKPDGSTVPDKWISSYPNDIASSNKLGSHGPKIDNLTPGYVDSLSNVYTIQATDTIMVSFDIANESIDLTTISALGGTDITTITGLNNGKFLASYKDISSSKVNITEINFNDITAGGTNLGAIISDMTDRSGFNNTQDLDVTDCTSIPVPGYSIRDRTPARDSIEEVSVPFFVDPVVSDWKLKFVPRGSDVEHLIEYNDLGCVEGDSYEDPYAITLPEENSLPKEVDFRYLGKDNSYLTSHQRVARHSQAINSEDKKTINTFVVLEDSYAKEAAVKFLTNRWLNSKRVSIKIPKKYSYLEPTDIIQFLTKTGILVTARILELYNTFNALEIGAEIESYDEYESLDYSAYAAGFNTSNLQKIPLIGTMVVAIVDSLPLFDIYNISPAYASESYVYVGGSSYFSQWPGGTVYVSTDNIDFQPSSGLNIPCFTGNITSSTDLSKMPNNYRIIDKINTITVDFIRDPSLTSTTVETLLKGGINLLHIKNSAGGEIIAATTVSNSGNRYTFSNLLRGRYHTYKNITSNGTDTTSAGTLVTLIDTTNILQAAMPYGIYDNTYYYKGVTKDADINTVNSKSTYYRGRWNDSAPVAHLDAKKVSSDIVVNWVAVANDNSNTFWSPPTYTTKYKMEVYDITGTLAGTYPDITTNTYTYTATNMTSDGTSITDSLTFRVYRESAMKGYDTLYSSYTYSSTLEDAISEISTPQLLYTFDDFSGGVVVDQIQSATNPDLTATAGTLSNRLRYPSVLKNKRKSGTLRFDGTTSTVLSTTSTTAGADNYDFSFMLVFRVTKATTSDVIKLVTRDGASTHEYGITIDGSGDIVFNGDLHSTENVGTIGDTICVVVTTDNDTYPTGQTEIVYVNGVEDGTDGTASASAWTGEFEIGDVNGIMNTTTDVVIELFSYWNGTKLSATQVANLYNAYLGAKS